MRECRPAALARIRENQRRSRARRKEYTRHLEEQLRSFQSLGVAASQEVQEAGRKVAKENALLRSLLIYHGVSKEEIKKYLESQATYIPPISSLAPTNSHSTVVPGDPLMKCRDARTSPSREVNSSPLELVTAGAQRSLSRSGTKGYIGHNIEGPSAERSAALSSRTAETVSKAQDVGGASNIGQLTSCENAARIIASLRDYPDIHDLRSELGCDSESNCMVKNMSIFDVLDK
ncbi:hypothetical protein N7510_001356 [Penicillium lagena]|uniref:uncharacterized protein n=1 Tax=Penicillium lagena TaxID=94218 RepID=UPI002541D81D|nr:uncharacterized protein N7510_001356 [Penicillium lagena]KAJ5625047.1 hypothetical protein N7510_001356 [Penicillium lagena]